jgi:glycosyltransferase involved in cell wall biosynthesis
MGPVTVLSLSRQKVADYQDGTIAVSHIYTRAADTAINDYAGLGHLARHVDATLRSRHVDVVHLFGLPLALAPLIRRHGPRVVTHITVGHHAYQGLIEGIRASVGWRLFDRWIDAYALSSPALRAPLAGRGLPASKCSVIPAAVDTQYFRPGSSVAARTELRLEQNEPLVVYMGTLSPLRFPAHAVGQALSDVVREIGVPLQLHAFAPQATHPYNRSWAVAAERDLRGLAGLKAHVHVSDLSTAEKRLWFQAADAVLLPFAGPVAVEPPLTLLEAMACGAQVLVSPEANRSHLVHSHQNGFVYHTEDEMVRHLRTMLLNRSAQRDLRVSARQTVREKHSLAAAARATLRLWDRLQKDGASWH